MGASAKGGQPGQKRRGAYQKDATRNLVDHRSGKNPNPNRFGVERNKSNIQIGKPDPAWEKWKRGKAVENRAAEHRRDGGVDAAIVVPKDNRKVCHNIWNAHAWP